MAARPPSPPQVSNHYLTQTALAVGLARLVAGLWPSVDINNLSASLPEFKLAVRALVHRFSAASGALASREYSRQRVEAGIQSSFTVPVANAPTAKQIDEAVAWATKSLWDRGLLTVTVDVQSALATAETKVAGAIEKLVLDTGRQTMIDAVEADRVARIWAREAKPGACYFCALMASRGAVYLSAGSAGLDANERFIGDGVAKFHDHCRCQVVPVFGKYEPTAHARQWTADYERLKESLGRSPSLLEWRNFYAGQSRESHSPGASGSMTPGGLSHD